MLPPLWTNLQTIRATSSARLVPFFAASPSLPLAASLLVGRAASPSPSSSSVNKPEDRTIEPVSRDKMRVPCTPGRDESRARRFAVSSDGVGCCMMADVVW